MKKMLTIGLCRWCGTTFLDEVLHSEDCQRASIGSPDLWFDAMAALVHATNDSGAFGTDRGTLHAE